MGLIKKNRLNTMSYDLSKLHRSQDFKIGICYYDPIRESLINVGHNSGEILGADPYKHVMHKFMLVTGKTDSISRIVVKAIGTDELRAAFDIKLLFANTRPSLMSFEEQPSFNEIEVNQPVQPNSIIPFYIYIKANSDISKMSELPIEVYYE